MARNTLECLILETLQEENGLLIYLPKHNTFLTIVEGAGGNLLQEDWDEGFVDYIDYQIYDGTGTEIDGGMIMLKEPFRDRYPEEARNDLIKTVLDLEYNDDPQYQIIR